MSQATAKDSDSTHRVQQNMVLACFGTLRAMLGWPSYYSTVHVYSIITTSHCARIVGVALSLNKVSTLLLVWAYEQMASVESFSRIGGELDDLMMFRWTVLVLKSVRFDRER